MPSARDSSPLSAMPPLDRPADGFLFLEGVALLTLVDTIHSVSESVRRAGGVTGELTTALTGPGTGAKLHASLDELRRNQARDRTRSRRSTQIDPDRTSV